MSNVWKINMVQNYTTRDDFNKLTFKKGDSFSARILRLEGSTTDVIIKLLDGRVFPARVDGDILQENLDDYMFKFQLDGFEGGKFLLRILESNVIDSLGNNGDSAIKDPLMEELLKNLDFPVGKEDVPILKSMLKNNIPITEENLLEIKGLKEFIDQSNNSPKELNKFIDKFIEAKGIQNNSSEAEQIKATLGRVLNEIKNLKIDDVFVMKALDIKLNEYNIKAFSKVISNEYSILPEIKETTNVIKEQIIGNINKDTQGEVIVNRNSTISEGDKLIYSEKDSSQPMVSIKESLENKEAILSSEKMVNKEGKHSNDIINERTIGIVNDEEDLLGKMASHGKDEVDSTNKLFKQLKSDIMVDRSITSTMVKDELREKISFIKNDLMELIKLSQKETSTFNNVIQNLETKFQEFKMFNTINNNYYFLNVPLDMKDKEYDCKLIIKDERSKGKKLDTENIKIAASVATVNMEKVDAYLTVNKNSATIEIESEATYVKILERFKGKLINDLMDSKYMFNIFIKEKKHDFSFSNCRSFFEDDDFTTINTRV
ncbi:hypothetical protein IO99_09045 [Clostridium sulfidigenes]|uniref:Rhoptry protein n=1 Tax=Clostridium sulfidigenes TaxID=318464 RepID=A0A084JCD2_9CLOT|nr:hypothetical protein [Clostridium sulfidigenes]KEZ86616.1 hypothetical protein IO99_09045 [Clostridium sulfidigenes]HBA04752.1 hypothetical protein [Clostridium sp.]